MRANASLAGVLGLVHQSNVTYDKRAKSSTCYGVTERLDKSSRQSMRMVFSNHAYFAIFRSEDHSRIWGNRRLFA
jgi:hypothetical protein